MDEETLAIDDLGNLDVYWSLHSLTKARMRPGDKIISETDQISAFIYTILYTSNHIIKIEKYFLYWSILMGNGSW